MEAMYIHIPFCEHICSYCDFPKVYYEENLCLKYLDALNEEINKYYNGEEIHTLYIGGGTPSHLSKNALFRLNTTKTIVLFFLYAALNGLTFGFLFYIVSARDLFYIFLISAGYFGLMAALSSLFKNALSKASNFFLIGLACLLIMSIVSAIFWYNNTLMLAVSIVGLIIFGGLTAFDVRWIKNMMDNSPNASSLAIYGAFHLYLDFINIFVYLVRIFASTNRN